MHATLAIDGEKLQYREDGVLKFSYNGNPDETLVCIPSSGCDYRNIIIGQLLKRISSAKYACEYALQDLVDECNDDGEVAENLRSALSDINNKHL